MSSPASRGLSFENVNNSSTAADKAIFVGDTTFQRHLADTQISARVSAPQFTRGSVTYLLALAAVKVLSCGLILPAAVIIAVSKVNAK
jgi:hypothetical protein